MESTSGLFTELLLYCCVYFCGSPSKKLKNCYSRLKMQKIRKQRLQKLFFIFALSGIGVSLILYSLNSKLDLFYTPSEMTAASLNAETRIKLGGMVKAESIKRLGTTVQFIVTDYQSEVAVSYEGITPDLFKEESGVVALGYFTNGVFAADQIFAKHDENYMPPELKMTEQQL